MKVLLGVDGSERSYRALEAAIERGTAADDELAVAVPDETVGDVAAETVGERVRETVEDAPIEGAVRRIDGDPGPALVELADREGFDRIVLGSGRESPLGKIRLDPTAEFVLLNARVPVTLVR